ncbi:MAG: family 43 glycosylhydrolase [Clostridia bacterium]|nr:family 43 glycosylhydrolase [Clostridia bacterium]
MKNIIKILAVLLMTATAFAVYAYAAEIPFDDVAADAWYYDTVVEAYETGVMKGQSETKFAPMVTMSRSEFVMLLYRITGVTETGFADELKKFADGETDEWYSEAMGWGVKRGLIKGMDDNTVRPAQTVTRAELAVMIVRYLSYRGITLPDAADEVTFTDDAKIADWAREQIYTCQIWGIFKGDDAGNFNPANKATRAEGATIILRLTKSADEVIENLGIVLCRTGEKSDFDIIFNFGSGGNQEDVTFTQDRIQKELDMTFSTKPFRADSVASYNLQFVFNVEGYPEIDEMKKSMGADSYAVKVVREGEHVKVLFAYTSPFAGTYAVEYLLATYVKDGVFAIPADLDIKGTKSPDDFFNTIYSIDRNTRDPFIYVENGTYYMYVTGWRVYKATSLTGEWTQIKNAVKKPSDYETNPYAPEVYKYNGKYYMFTAYKPEQKLNEFDNRGCIIMEADSPEGPFEMITDGWITPEEWDCIDGTLYVDADGQPWMIFSREHTCYDGNGAFCAAKLSDGFTHFISEPVELFRGKDPKWEWDGVTDGCFMYTNADGELLMLWSNNDKYGYCVAVSKSTNGRLDGEWDHNSQPMLYTAFAAGFDGGHGMIFTDTDGQMYLVIHSPNDWKGDSSRATVIPITERNGMLIWDVLAD